MSQSWETKEDIQKAFVAAGLPVLESNLVRKLERRREQGLLPPVDQAHPKGLRGSETHYPLGTGAQAVEIEKLLLLEKRNFKYVGWQMWWQGYQVDERHWLRRLRLIARVGDRLLRKIREAAAEREMRNLPSTIFDEIGDAISNDSRLSKIKRRVGQEDMSALLGIVVGSVTDGFNANVDAGDEKILEAGFDFSRARTDQILGHKLALMDALPAFFALISNTRREITAF
jgi:hypothetical protein